MNRITVVFLALAILLAHTLAIHQTPQGDFAPPYDRAHVAFRIARNLVHQGHAAWDTVGVAGAWSEAYPSALWVAIAAVAERTFLYPTWTAQLVGILSSLLTIVVLTRFGTYRMASLIAPILFATTGATAAAAASGTEAPLAMLLASTAFLAFERGRGVVLATALVLLCLCRPEGLFLLLAFVLLEILDRPSPPPVEGKPPRGSVRRSLSVAAGVVALLTIARGLWIGEWIAPFTANVLQPDGARVELGLAYLGDFFWTSPSALLLILPVTFLAFGRSSAVGRRALLLFLVWCLVTVMNGGDGLPCWNAVAPALPLAFVAIQSEMTDWLDRTPRHTPIAWSILGVTVVAALLASKLPGDFGPLKLESALNAWMEPNARLASAHPRKLGRTGLLDESREVDRLRKVGIFLRDKVPADARIATFWPGAIGYLSRKRVYDLLGRTQPPPGEEKAESWNGAPRVDLVRALAEPADYLVLSTGTEGLPLTDLLHQWLARFDSVGDTPARMQELTTVLRRFEVVSVPIPASEDRPEQPSPNPFLLLRNRDLHLMPRVELTLDPSDGRRFRVETRHAGHRQIVHLAVQFRAQDGTLYHLRPTGSWDREASVDARNDLLVYDTGPRPIRMLEGTLPADAGAGELTARLRSPGITSTSEFAAASEPASVRIGG